MPASQYSVFYNYFGKFRRLPVEGLLKSDSEGANGSLPFFKSNCSMITSKKEKL